jgi:hypothetical protein
MRSWLCSIRLPSALFCSPAAYRAAGFLAVTGALLLCAWGGRGGPAMPALAAGPPPPLRSVDGGAAASVFVPAVYGRSIPEVVSRAGLVVTSGALSSYPLERLPFGWYADYAVREAPARPGGVEYMQTILVRPEKYPPDWDLLRRAAEANPGAIWKVGNEPECIYQGMRTPEAYADIYHEVHTFLKGVDPTARVAIGSIVQPTPLRLEWLDRTRAAYRARYGETMPVDVWNIHNLVLQEHAEDYGCGIPVGIAASEGRLYPWWDSANADLFVQHIWDFRRWMAEHGERDKPLIISEMGVLYPSSWFDSLTEAPSGEQRITDFMEGTFTFMQDAADPDLGYPADGNRLVQGWLWFSLDHRAWDEAPGEGFNGNLCDRDTRSLTPFGVYYEGLMQRLQRHAGE